VILRCALALFLLMKNDLMRLSSAVDFYAELQGIPTALANDHFPLFPHRTLLEVRPSMCRRPLPSLARSPGSPCHHGARAA